MVYSYSQLYLVCVRVASFFDTQFSFTAHTLSHFQYTLFRAEYSPCVMPETTIFTESWLLGYNHLQSLNEGTVLARISKTPEDGL
jgi:hypothetical protein